jgi:hypothetical protein
MSKTLLFLFLITCSFARSQTSKRVFFIGNSYTYVNDLPNLIKSIAASTGDILNHQSQTIGGATLESHFNSTTAGILTQGNWDYVVLQEQSQLPSLPDQEVQNKVYYYASQLSNFIKGSNGCGNVIFYMTWGRKNGDAARCATQPNVCTYEGMDDLIYQRYMEMAQTNEGIVSPVGKVWRAIRQTDPTMELYDLDESHPSYIGSMAAAYTFYVILYKKDPTLVSYNGSLTPTQAQFIKNVVKTTVFNNLNTWYVDANDVHSRFTYQFTGTSTVQFTNKTQGATTYLWNFGDGKTSTLKDPLHTFTSAGNYTIKLTTNACGTNTTKEKVLTINTLGTEELAMEDPVQIYPNPTENVVNLITKERVELLSTTDAGGRIVSCHLDKMSSGYALTVSHLTSGIYFIKYKMGEKVFTKKIIKK